MKTLTLSLLAATTLFAGALVYAHCEVPCGIYGDKARIVMLYEHTTTIEKSMQQISALAGKHEALAVNQSVRWVNNKDEHATKLQHIVTQYFMTQRIKLPKEGDAKAEAKYMHELKCLHKMLIYAMKSKQTLDVKNAAKLRTAIDKFQASYLSKADQAHIKEHHGGK